MIYINSDKIFNTRYMYTGNEKQNILTFQEIRKKNQRLTLVHYPYSKKIFILVIIYIIDINIFAYFKEKYYVC